MAHLTEIEQCPLGLDYIFRLCSVLLLTWLMKDLDIYISSSYNRYIHNGGNIMNYKQLQARLRLYREAGYTDISLNKSYMILAREYSRVVDLASSVVYKVN